MSCVSPAGELGCPSPSLGLPALAARNDGKKIDIQTDDETQTSESQDDARKGEERGGVTLAVKERKIMGRYTPGRSPRT